MANRQVVAPAEGSGDLQGVAHDQNDIGCCSELLQGIQPERQQTAEARILEHEQLWFGQLVLQELQHERAQWLQRLAAKKLGGQCLIWNSVGLG